MKFTSYYDFCMAILEKPWQKQIAHASADFVRVSSSNHLTMFMDEISMCPVAWKQGEYFFEAFIFPTNYFSAIYSCISG